MYVVLHGQPAESRLGWDGCWWLRRRCWRCHPWSWWMWWTRFSEAGFMSLWSTFVGWRIKLTMIDSKSNLCRFSAAANQTGMPTAGIQVVRKICFRWTTVPHVSVIRLHKQVVPDCWMEYLRWRCTCFLATILVPCRDGSFHFRFRLPVERRRESPYFWLIGNSLNKIKTKQIKHLHSPDTTV